MSGLFTLSSWVDLTWVKCGQLIFTWVKCGAAVFLQILLPLAPHSRWQHLQTYPSLTLYNLKSASDFSTRFASFLGQFWDSFLEQLQDLKIFLDLR